MRQDKSSTVQRCTTNTFDTDTFVHPGCVAAWLWRDERRSHAAAHSRGAQMNVYATMQVRTGQCHVSSDNNSVQCCYVLGGVPGPQQGPQHARCAFRPPVTATLRGGQAEAASSRLAVESTALRGRWHPGHGPAAAEATCSRGWVLADRCYAPPANGAGDAAVETGQRRQ